jgi:hypothetical protein
MDDVYRKQMSKFQRPIPGMSLTNNPDEPLPFEGPPEFTKRKDAIENIFGAMIEERNYSQMIDTLERGKSVMEVTQLLLFQGFRQGKWNPDMFLTLIEPTAYMIMALAERAGVTDIVIDNEEDDIEQDEADELSKSSSALEKAKARVTSSTTPAGVLPKEIMEQIEGGDLPSLIERPEAGAVMSEEMPEGMVEDMGEEMPDMAEEESLFS